MTFLPCGGKDEGDTLLSILALSPVAGRRVSLGLSKRESWPCPSPDAALGRASPAPYLGSTVEPALDVGTVGEPALRGRSTRELTLTLVCHAVAQMRERYLPSFPHALPPMAGGKAGPGVMREEKLAMSFTSHTIWNSRSFTSPGQQGRADPDCRGSLVSQPQGHENR